MSLAERPGEDMAFLLNQRALERDGARLIRELKGLVRSSRSTAAIARRLELKLAKAEVERRRLHRALEAAAAKSRALQRRRR